MKQKSEIEMGEKNQEMCKNPYCRDVACYVSTSEFILGAEIGVAR
jgi:hypothetical protein